MNFKKAITRLASHLKSEEEQYKGNTIHGEVVKGSLDKVMNTPDIDYGTIDLDL